MSQRRPRTIRNKGVIAAARRQLTPPGQRLAFRTDPWTRRLIRPLLIVVLATSMAVALLALVRVLSPDRAWMALVPLCFLAALEGTYTAAWLNNPDSHGVDRAAYRAAEVLLLLALARIYSWVIFAQGIPTPEEMRLFLTAPVSVFVTGAFFTTALVTLLVWWMAVTISRIFAQLDVSIYELNFYTLSQVEQKEKADDRPIQVAREELQNQYLKAWLFIGMGIIIIAALSTYEVDQLATVTNPFEITRLGLSPAMLFALLTYFLVGFWLLSHARLLRMNARWLMDGVAKEANLERGWQRSVLIVLLAIALIAAFLPIGSTLAISRILTVGLSGFGYLAGLVVSFFGYLFASALILLTRNVEDTPAPPPTLTPPPLATPAPIPPATPNPIMSMVISSAFWALLIAFVIGSLLFFLRERGYRVDIDRARSYGIAITGWLREIWARLTGRARAVGREWRARMRDTGTVLKPQTGSPLPRPRLIRLNALSPREQIRYYYLALVRRAGERGVGRRESETPLEYVQNLKEVWPEAEGDLDELTQAFLEARYSPQPIEKADANSIKERWKRLKARLRPPR